MHWYSPGRAPPSSNSRAHSTSPWPHAKCSAVAPRCDSGGEWALRSAVSNPAETALTFGKPYRTRGGNKTPCVFPRSRLRFTQEAGAEGAVAVSVGTRRKQGQGQPHHVARVDRELLLGRGTQKLRDCCRVPLHSHVQCQRARAACRYAQSLAGGGQKSQRVPHADQRWVPAESSGGGLVPGQATCAAARCSAVQPRSSAAASSACASPAAASSSVRSTAGSPKPKAKRA